VRVILLNILSFVILSQFSFSQEKLMVTDSVYINVFKDVSVYKDFSEVYLGNIGLAKYNILSPFKDNSNSIYDVFANSNKVDAYTDIFFTTGSGKEGIININHKQQLSKMIGVNLNILRSSSEGLYLDQKASLSKLKGDILYESKNKRYNLNFSVDFYKRINELNGGINDTVFDLLFDDGGLKLLYPTNLSNANLEKSSRVLDLTHEYKIKADSVSTFGLRQNINYVTEKFEYVDGNNSFYKNYFIDSSSSYDTLVIKYLTHNFYVDYKTEKLNYYLGISNSYADYKADSVFIPSMIHSALGGVSYKENKINFTSTFSYTFNGFLKGNMFFRNSLTYSDTTLLLNEIILNGEYAITTPTLYHSQYYSNHLKWNNILNTENKLVVNINATSSKYKLKIGGEFQLRDNYLYYDTLSLVAQKQVVFYQLNASKHFEITKWLHFIPSVFYQDVISDENIDLPSFVTQARFYGQGKLFKKILTFKVGVDVLYYTDFYSKAYNPSFDNFYIQNSFKAGSYPFIDIFAEFYSKKNLAFFIKATHANYGIFGSSYSATSNYHQQDRTINFGVKWRLFN
jgi:hypothetical protein